MEWQDVEPAIEKLETESEFGGRPLTGIITKN